MEISALGVAIFVTLFGGASILMAIRNFTALAVAFTLMTVVFVWGNVFLHYFGHRV